MNSTANKEALKTELDAIRAEIRAIDRPDRKVGEPKKLRELMEKHNRIVDDIHLLEQKPRCDPIDRLPEEVSVAILKQAAVRDSHGSSFISTDLVLLLTLVSSKWRSFIESTPTLWSDIVLDDQREDLAMKFTISLLFSREAFLAVQLVNPLRCWNKIESIIVPRAGRIRSIYLVGNGADNSIFLFNVKQLLTPQLRSIDWSQHNHTPGKGEEIFLSGQCEHLHSITGTLISREVLHSSSMRSLRKFATHEDANHVLTKTLPNLEEVVFMENLYSDKESMGIPLTTETLRWTSLIYHQGIMETLTSLLNRLPLLRDLRLLITYDDLSHLIYSMRNLKVLHRLEIAVRNIPSKTFVPPVTIEPLNQVRTFIFSEHSRIWKISDRAKVSQIPNALLSLLPNVEVLRIKSSVNSTVHELTSAIGFRKVHTLILERADTGASPSDFKFSESVRNLKINVNSPSRYITPGVEWLQVVGLDLHNAGSQYSTVKRLHLAYFEGSSDNFQRFTALTEFRVDGDKAVTIFCTIIATSPATCPALHALLFGQFPDLDILFIMLERRNFYSLSKTARIRKLELPIRMSLSNFRTVRELLRGRIVERQSNFEASLQSNIDMFLDPNIPGCIACHKGQVFCSEPILRTTSPQPPPMPPYPATVEDIINTWDVRSRPTRMLQFRSSSCRGDKDLTQITEESLEW